MTQKKATGRRGLLKRLAFLSAGAIGLGVTGASAASLPAPPSATTLRLYGRGWHVYSNTQPRGSAPGKGERFSSYGELVDGPDGEKVGDFFGTIVSMRSPFAAGPAGGASLEIHSFVMNEGTVFGLGNLLPNGEPTDTFAIVGGTGRYAGARGTYVSRQAHRGLGGDGTADFTFNLSL